MNFLNFFAKEKKSAPVTAKAISNETFKEFIRQGCRKNVSAGGAYEMYTQVSAVSDAVDTIANKFAGITPVVKDNDGNLVENQGAIDLLQAPNKLQNYHDFATDLATNYLLNKNAFVQMRGFVKALPKSLHVVPNTKVSISESINSARYTVEETGFYEFLSGDFIITEDTGRIISINNIGEMFHIKGLSQIRSQLLAPNVLSSLDKEISVFDQSLLKIVSLLKNGFTSAGIVNLDTEDQEAFEEFTKQFSHYVGAGNSGKAIVSKGKDITYTSIDQTNRDMQTLENKRDSKNSIYQRFDIPLPKVDGSSQTYSNYATANLALYDDAVLPLADTLFSNLTKMMRTRTLLAEDEHISYDTRSISALQIRSNEELKLLSEVGVLTINELRARAGYEAIEGGDALMVQANQVEIAKDDYTEDNLEKPKQKYLKQMETFGHSQKDAEEFWDAYKDIIRKE